MRSKKIIYLFLDQSICCGYSKHMLKIMGKKTFTFLSFFFFFFFFFGGGGYLNLCLDLGT